MSGALPALLAAGGAAAAAGGVGLLWTAWKRHPGPRVGLITLGWGLLIVAGVLLAPWAGGDRAVALETLIVAAAATAMVIFSGRWTSPKGRKAKAVRAVDATPAPAMGPATGPWRTAATVLLAGPIALVAALSGGLALAVRSPGSPADKLVAAAFGAPLLWSMAMIWTCADPKLTRTALVLAAFAVACAGLGLLGRGA